MPIVTDSGFRANDLSEGFTTLDALPEDGPVALDLGPDADLAPVLARLGDVTAIRIGFSSFADGRGFTLARALRRAGYAGRLRAAGHVLADQYAMIRRCGFDEVEIDQDLATRQPEEQWLARADWINHDYQARLGRRPDAA